MNFLLAVIPFSKHKQTRCVAMQFCLGKIASFGSFSFVKILPNELIVFLYFLPQIVQLFY